MNDDELEDFEKNLETLVVFKLFDFLKIIFLIVWAVLLIWGSWQAQTGEYTHAQLFPWAGWNSG